MKKQYIILSIFILLTITFTVLTIVFFHEYKDITKEIVSKELSYDFSSLFPIGTSEEGVSITPKERPDTSTLSAKADNMKLGGIIFLILAIISLGLTIFYLIRILKERKSLAQ